MTINIIRLFVAKAAAPINDKYPPRSLRKIFAALRGKRARVRRNSEEISQSPEKLHRNDNQYHSFIRGKN